MFNLKREGMAEKELKSIIIIKKDREKKKEKKWKRKVGESRSLEKNRTTQHIILYTRQKANSRQQSYGQRKYLFQLLSNML